MLKGVLFLVNVFFIFGKEFFLYLIFQDYSSFIERLALELSSINILCVKIFQAIALNNSFIDYKGTLLFYSHDHEFINTVANRIIEIGPLGMIDRNSTYDDYIDDETIKERRLAIYNKVATK